jgi:CrcB protein
VRLIIIAIGGVLGSLARYALDLALPWTGGIAWSTLLVNILGSLVIGVVATTVVHTRPWVRPFVIVGVLGGFTTFSAFALQAGTLLDSGQVAAALGYVALTLVGGIVAVEAGAAVGTRMRGVTT